MATMKTFVVMAGRGRDELVMVAGAMVDTSGGGSSDGSVW